MAGLNTISLNMGPASLLILPLGFNPSTSFGSYNGLGLPYVRGTTLNVPAGSTFIGSITITDPVACQGTIMAIAGSSIGLNNGLTMSGTANVNLGSGFLIINDQNSQMSGGSFQAGGMLIGGGSTGTFAQSGGINGLTQLNLASNAQDFGTYNLSGNALVTVGSNGQYIGLGGSGVFNQTGGTNYSNGHYVFLAYEAGSSGMYNLSGTGLLQLATSGYEYIGYGGVAKFSQSGGTNSAGYIAVGGGPLGGVGTYVLNAGLVSGKSSILAKARLPLGPSRKPGAQTAQAACKC